MANSSSCYNHDDRCAVYNCFDCKEDIVVKYCEECHEQIHSLQVFRLHKTQSINKGKQRKLSQDVTDLETLMFVEKGILDNVLTTLKYTEQQEREMLQEVIPKTEKRLHDIQQCHEKVDKALLYLAKMSSMIKFCSEPTISLPGNSALSPSASDTSDQNQALEWQIPVTVVGSLNKKGHFSMIKTGTAYVEKLSKIENDLKIHFQEGSESASAPLIKKGTICVAANQSQTEFWRVRVDRLCPNELVKVFYLDRGLHEDIPVSSLTELPPAMKDIPYQAMECCLFPQSQEIALPYEAKWCFKDLTYNKDLRAQVCSTVIFPQGNTLFHMQLLAVGPPPVNINQKVTDLVTQKELDQEDRPKLPKDCPTKDEPAGQSQIEESYSTSPVSSDQPAIPQAKKETEPPMCSTITILSKPSEEVATNSDVARNPAVSAPITKAAPTKILAASIPEYIPIGHLNEHMYNKIFNECKTNAAQVKPLLTHARFYVAKVDETQLAEAMKTKIWCCTEESLALNIDKVYREQVLRGSKHTVFMIFTMKQFVVGFVRIVSQMKRSRTGCTIVGRGLLWSHYCYGEFCLELFHATKLPFKIFDLYAGYLRQFGKENSAGKEIRWEKGASICQKYERVNENATSVLDNACRMYKKDFHKEFPPSHEEEEKLEDEAKKGQKSGRRNSKDKDAEIPDAKERQEKHKDGTTSSIEDWEPQLEAEPYNIAETSMYIGSPFASQDSTDEGSSSPEITLQESTCSPTCVPTAEVIDTNSSEFVTSVNGNCEQEIQEKEARQENQMENSEIEKCELETELQKTSAMEDSEHSTEIGGNMTVLQEESKTDYLELELQQEKVCGLDVKKVDSENEVDVTEKRNGTDQKTLSAEEISQSQEFGSPCSVSGGQQEPELSHDELCETAAKCPEPSFNHDLPGDVSADAEETEERCKQQLPALSDAVNAERNNVPTIHSDNPSSEEDHTKSSNYQVFKSNGERRLSPVSFYIVTPPEDDQKLPLEAATSPEVTEPKLASEESQPSKLQENPETEESCNQEINFGVPLKPTGDYGASGHMTEEDVLWDEGDSFVTTDKEPTKDDPENRDIGHLSNRLIFKSTGATSCASFGEKESHDGEDDFCFLPVIAGKRYRVIMKTVPDREGRFVARIYRDFEEEKVFLRFIKSMGASVEKANQKLSNVHLMKHCCLVRKKYNHNCYIELYDRALITDVLGEGKVMVRLVDVGNTKEVHVDDLREVDSEFQVNFPPQAFECRIPNKGMLDKLLGHKIRTKNGRNLNILVEAISGEVAEIQILRIL